MSGVDSDYIDGFDYFGEPTSQNSHVGSQRQADGLGKGYSVTLLQRILIMAMDTCTRMGRAVGKDESGGYAAGEDLDNLLAELQQIVARMGSHADILIDSHRNSKMMQSPMREQRTPARNIVEVPVEVTVASERLVEVPVHVQKITEVPEYYTITKEKTKPVECILRREELVEVPKVKYVTIDKKVEKPVIEYVTKEVPVTIPRTVEAIKEIPVEEVITVEKIVQKGVPTVVEVEKTVEVPIIAYVDKIVEVTKEIVIEKVVTVPKEVVVTREKAVEVPTYRYVDQPKHVTVDHVVHIEKVVEVPKEELIEVERKIEVIKPMYKTRDIEVPKAVQLQQTISMEVPVERHTVIETKHWDRFETSKVEMEADHFQAFESKATARSPSIVGGISPRPSNFLNTLSSIASPSSRSSSITSTSLGKDRRRATSLGSTKRGSVHSRAPAQHAQEWKDDFSSSSDKNSKPQPTRSPSYKYNQNPVSPWRASLRAGSTSSTSKIEDSTDSVLSPLSYTRATLAHKEEYMTSTARPLFPTPNSVNSTLTI